jgi:hypothetical protein
MDSSKFGVLGFCLSLALLLVADWIAINMGNPKPIPSFR